MPPHISPYIFSVHNGSSLTVPSLQQHSANWKRKNHYELQKKQKKTAIPQNKSVSSAQPYIMISSFVVTARQIQNTGSCLSSFLLIQVLKFWSLWLVLLLLPGSSYDEHLQGSRSDSTEQMKSLLWLTENINSHEDKRQSSPACFTDYSLPIIRLSTGWTGEFGFPKENKTYLICV